MKAVNLLLGLLVCMTLGLPARGASASDDWKYVAMSEKGDRLFYDSASLIAIPGGVTEVWLKKIGADGSYLRIRAEINCSFKIIRDRQVITDIPGRVRPDRDIDPTWRAMELDPAMLELFKILCK